MGRDQSTRSFPKPPYRRPGRRRDRSRRPRARHRDHRDHRLRDHHRAGLRRPDPAPAFLHGVASGDPLPDGVLLWTRVTPEPGAEPGSGRGADTPVRWEVAEDREFTAIAASGTTLAAASSDHTVKADVRGLRPATTYYYRFTASGPDPEGGEVRSPTGRTRTAPAVGASVAGVRFGVVSCANWEAGWFSAYRHLAARGDLDAVVHLGDYLYEYGSGSTPPRARPCGSTAPPTRSWTWPTTAPGTGTTRPTPTSRRCTPPTR